MRGIDDTFDFMEGNMDSAAFNTLAAARELEAAGMDRGLAEVTALNMHRAGTAHLDQLATKADLENHGLATQAALESHRQTTESALENHRVATKADIADLRADMLKVALGIVIANAAFVVANTGLVIAVVKFL